jgi:hypothetical protein
MQYPLAAAERAGISVRGIQVLEKRIVYGHTETPHGR